MIGVGLKIEIKKSKLLTDAQRTLALPIVEATQYLADLVLTRIRQGQGPHGPWDTYASDGPNEGGGKFWVAPGRPQPGTPGQGGLAFRVTTGRWAGWAAYTSIKGYYDERGLTGRPHDFEETGRLMRATSIRIVTPRHARLAFYGSHGKLSAKQVAWLTSRDEAYPLLMPSPAEVERFQAFITGRINEAIIEGARLGEQAQKLSAQSRSTQRRAARLLGDGGGRRR